MSGHSPKQIFTLYSITLYYILFSSPQTLNKLLKHAAAQNTFWCFVSVLNHVCKWNIKKWAVTLQKSALFSTLHPPSPPRHEQSCVQTVLETHCIKITDGYYGLHLLRWGLLLHRTHFVLWDGQLSKRAAVGRRIIRPGWRSATHRDPGCNGWHFPRLTLYGNSRSLWGLVQVAVRYRPHAGEELD